MNVLNFNRFLILSVFLGFYLVNFCSYFLFSFYFGFLFNPYTDLASIPEDYFDLYFNI